MTAYVLWVLMLFGLVYLVTESTIMMPVRMFFTKHLGVVFEILIYCGPCSAFWIGLVLASLGYWPQQGPWALGECAVASVALVSAWQHVTGSGTAWLNEQPPKLDSLDDTTQKSQERPEG